MNGNQNSRESDKDPGIKALDTLFQGGIPQTGILVALITTLAQPFGEENIKGLLAHIFGLGESVQYSLVVAAMVISFIFAVWIVRYVQKLYGGKCILMITLVWITLFSMSLGANNGVKTAGSDFAQVKEENQILKHKNKEMQKELDGTLKALDEIKNNLLVPAQANTPVSFWEKIGFVSKAYAQSDMDNSTALNIHNATSLEVHNASISAPNQIEAIKQLDSLTKRLEELKKQQSKSDSDKVKKEMPQRARYSNKIMF